MKILKLRSQKIGTSYLRLMFFKFKIFFKMLKKLFKLGLQKFREWVNLRLVRCDGITKASFADRMAERLVWLEDTIKGPLRRF